MATSVEFADAARNIARTARARGLDVPGFRSPPRDPNATRTIRRHPDRVVVAVRIQHRRVADVIADMIDGTIAANRLDPTRARIERAALHAATSHEVAA